MAATASRSRSPKTATGRSSVDAKSLGWRKSARSAQNGGNCVEIAVVD
jgi:hypothetical protein